MRDTQAQSLVALVPIRAGSKGFSGKNMQPLAGSPLYLHAVHQALRTVGQVILSTDIAQINQKSLPVGCTLSDRPAWLAEDDTPMKSVIAHLIETHGLHENTLVLLQATSPLRRDEDILRALELYQSGKHDMVFSVVKQNQSVLKYGTLDGEEFIPLQSGDYCFMNRQALPGVYGPNGAVFIFNSRKFLEKGSFPCGSVGVIKMSQERSIDIDCEEDLKKVESVWGMVHD